MARNAIGADVCVTSTSATCFCLEGALVRGSDMALKSRDVSGVMRYHLRQRAFDRVRMHLNTDAIFEFNDHEFTSYKDVMAVLDEAISQ